jgi:hypothetical protein
MMVMGINSVVDYPARIAVLCFRPISSGEKIDFAEQEIGFHRCLSQDPVRPHLLTADCLPGAIFAEKQGKNALLAG